MAQVKSRELGGKAGAQLGIVPVRLGPYDENVVDHYGFVADRPYRLIEVQSRLVVAGGASAAVMIEKVPSGTAIGAGTDMLASAIDLNAATANTNITVTNHATDANLEMATGDAIGLDFSGTLTGLVGLAINLLLLPLEDVLYWRSE